MSIGVVNTTLGKVEGVELDGKYEGVTLFKGIPYAAPPVGDLRWRPPQDAEHWQGVRKCTEYGPMCIQYQAMHLDTVYENMSEDCLYLNVATSAKRGEKRPVYLWLHGGGQTNGSSHEAAEDIREFARRGIVVVSVGHRLNIFGYMTLPQIRKELGGVSGSFGMMDLVKALDWITDNIEEFGGDPDNITAGGQSGGCQKACVLASIPASRGRIKRVINESGLKWVQEPFLTVPQAEEFGQNYLRHIGIDPDTPIEKLRAMGSYEIHQNVSRDYYAGDMIYDGKFITYPTLWECMEANLNRIDFLTFTTLGESNIFATHGAPSTYGSFIGELPIHDRESFYAFFKERLGDLYDKYDFGNIVSTDDEWAVANAKKLGSFGLAQICSNNYSRNLMVNRIFSYYLKKKHPDNKNFVSLWTKFTPVPRHNYGSDYDAEHPLPDHGNERWYVFGALEEGKPEGTHWTENDYKLSEICCSYWENFIKYGDPNGEGLPEWPEGADDYSYVVLDNEIKTMRGLEAPIDKLTYEYVMKEYGLDDIMARMDEINEKRAK